MNLLIDRPPDKVKIGNTEYQINTDFRVSVLFELLIQDEDVSDKDKIRQTIELYFPVIPVQENINDIFKAVIWFYKCGRTDKEIKLERDEISNDETNESETEETRAYSFDYDDEYIYAAFRQQYGINLATVNGLHWWEFRAMFKGLDHNCEFAKIMGYRTARITKEMSKSEKAFLRKMKTVHALPLSEKAQRRNDALINALKNGGDLTGIV